MEIKDTATIFPYKMTDEDTANLIKLRASNEALFTGKRNASKIAWRAVIREMGLQGKVTSGQTSKKWENLKKKYKELKFPPGGVGPGGDVTAASWHWFYLMNEAMEGRLSASAPALTAVSYGDDDPDSPAAATSRSHSRKRRKDAEKNEILEFLTGDAGRDESLGTEAKEAEVLEMYKADAYADREEAESERAAMETERERAGLEAERAGLHMQRAGFERELAAVDRDRAALEREKAGVDRDRAAVERDRALLEKDRASMERERAAMDRDWALLEKERASLERERALLHRDKEAVKNGTFEVKNDSPAAEPDAESLERRERFLSLFEKLIEKL